MEENRALRRQQEKDAATIWELRRRIDQLLKMQFGGAKTEALPRNQLELMLTGLPAVLEEAPAAPQTTSPARKLRRGVREGRWMMRGFPRARQ